MKALQIGIESSCSVTPVGCSNNRAARIPGELGRLTGFLFAQKPHLHYRTSPVHPWMNDYLVSDACLPWPKIPKVVFFFSISATGPQGKRPRGYSLPSSLRKQPIPAVKKGYIGQDNSSFKVPDFGFCKCEVKLNDSICSVRARLYTC